MNRQERIVDILSKALEPSSLSVMNESHKHKGHAGDDGTGETHFHIEMVSQRFEGLSRIACQRMVYDLLEAELQTGLHALSLRLSAKTE
jgi:stress-induced morphogen